MHSHGYCRWHSWVWAWKVTFCSTGLFSLMVSVQVSGAGRWWKWAGERWAVNPRRPKRSLQLQLLPTVGFSHTAQVAPDSFLFSHVSSFFSYENVLRCKEMHILIFSHDLSLFFYWKRSTVVYSCRPFFCDYLVLAIDIEAVKTSLVVPEDHEPSSKGLNR